MKSYSPKATIGTLGFLRVLLPKLLSSPSLDYATLSSIIEILEVCLHLLNDPSHTIINASLECICVIVNQPNTHLKMLLNSKSLEHNDILRNRKSLKNKIFNRKSSASSIELSRTEMIFLPTVDTRKETRTTTLTYPSTSTGITSIDDKNIQSEHESVIDDDVKKEKFNENRVQIPHSSDADSTTEDGGDGKNRLILTKGNDDKCLLSCSDNELESFKCIEFESTKLDATDSINESSIEKPSPSGGKRKKSDLISLKSQKSTESIGSFFSSILSHSNTGKYIKSYIC